MKKTIILGLSLFMLLTSCGQQPLPSVETENTTNQTETAFEESEAQKQTKDLHPEMRLQSAHYTGFVETEDVIYYYNWMKKRIYFSVDNGNHFSPLCSKANCSHSDESCNAFGQRLGYFEGSLYTLRFESEADHFQVVRISLDGSEQEVVRTVSLPGGGSFDVDFHNAKTLIDFETPLD